MPNLPSNFQRNYTSLYVCQNFGPHLPPPQSNSNNVGNTQMLYEGVSTSHWIEHGGPEKFAIHVHNRKVFCFYIS